MAYHIAGYFRMVDIFGFFVFRVLIQKLKLQNYYCAIGLFNFLQTKLPAIVVTGSGKPDYWSRI